MIKSYIYRESYRNFVNSTQEELEEDNSKKIVSDHAPNVRDKCVSINNLMRKVFSLSG